MAFIHSHLSKFIGPLILLLVVKARFWWLISPSNLPDFYDDSVLIYPWLPLGYLHRLNNTLTRTNNAFIFSLKPLFIALKRSCPHVSKLYDHIVILFADCLNDRVNKRQANFIGSRPWLLLLLLWFFCSSKAYRAEWSIWLSRPHYNNYKFLIILFNDDKYEWMLHYSSDFYKKLRNCQNQTNRRRNWIFIIFKKAFRKSLNSLFRRIWFKLQRNFFVSFAIISPYYFKMLNKAVFILTYLN